MGNLFFDKPRVEPVRNPNEYAISAHGQHIHVGDWVVRVAGHSSGSFQGRRGPYRVLRLGSKYGGGFQSISLETNIRAIAGDNDDSFEWDANKFEVVNNG